MQKSSRVSTFPCVANKRSGEVHRSGCAWEQMMKDRNRLPFNTVLAAQFRGFSNGCAHCFRELSPEVRKRDWSDKSLSLAIQNFSSVVNRGKVVNLLAKRDGFTPGQSVSVGFWGTISSGTYELLGSANMNSAGEAYFPFVIPMDTPSGYGDFKAVASDGGSATCPDHIWVPSMISSLSASPTSFKQKTSINFTMAGQAKIKVDIFNELGMHRRTLTEKMYNVGAQSTTWDGKNASGKVFTYATKGTYNVRVTVYTPDGSMAEFLDSLEINKTQWRP